MKIDISRYTHLEAPFLDFINKYKERYGVVGTVTRWSLACHLDLISCYLMYNKLTGEDVSEHVKRLKEFYGIKD